MSTYVFVVTVICSTATAIRALALVCRDRQRWSSYRHVYDNGGPRHLTAAAGALEPGDDDDHEDQ